MNEPEKFSNLDIEQLISKAKDKSEKEKNIQSDDTASFKKMRAGKSDIEQNIKSTIEGGTSLVSGFFRKASNVIEDLRNSLNSPADYKLSKKASVEILDKLSQYSYSEKSTLIKLSTIMMVLYLPLTALVLISAINFIPFILMLLFIMAMTFNSVTKKSEEQDLMNFFATYPVSFVKNNINIGSILYEALKTENTKFNQSLEQEINNHNLFREYIDVKDIRYKQIKKIKKDIRDVILKMERIKHHE